MIVYISGKYTDSTPEKVKDNIELAKTTAIALWNRGYKCVCPHLNTGWFEIETSATHKDFLDLDFRLISISDAVFMLPNWKTSRGARLEKGFAEKTGVPAVYNIDELDKFRAEWYGNGLEETMKFYDEIRGTARQRIRLGHKEYGMDWKRKDHIKELKEELYDSMNYPVLELMKLAYLRKKGNRACCEIK